MARAGRRDLRREPLKGKGNVVRRAFADIDADIYLLIDGDDTYDATAAPMLIETLVDGQPGPRVGVRREPPDDQGGLPPAHGPATGRSTGSSRDLRRQSWATCSAATGVLPALRQELPAVSREFEIETELTVHSLALSVPSSACHVGFRDRAEGTESKLRTYRDGSKILRLILSLARHERPIAFYGLIAALATAFGGALASPCSCSTSSPAWCRGSRHSWCRRS